MDGVFIRNGFLFDTINTLSGKYLSYTGPVRMSYACILRYLGPRRQGEIPKYRAS